MTIKDFCKKKGYSDDYAKYWIMHEMCEVCHDYSGPPHHIKSRGSGGKDNHENLAALCMYHHTEVHTIGWKTFIEKYPKMFVKFNRVLG